MITTIMHTLDSELGVEQSPVKIGGIKETLQLAPREVLAQAVISIASFILLIILLIYNVAQARMQTILNDRRITHIENLIVDRDKQINRLVISQEAYVADIKHRTDQYNRFIVNYSNDIKALKITNTLILKEIREIRK